MNPACPLCPGQGMFLGRLGNLKHFKCRDCGIGFHKRAKSRLWAGAKKGKS